MDYDNPVISHTVRFWLFLIALISSASCSILILNYTLSHRRRHRAINNHVIILLLLNNLIYEFVDIPLFLNFYRIGKVWPATKSLCLMWIFFDEALYTVSTFIVAWASIERHILIFHDQWLSTSRRRILVHYVPLAILITYVIIFHFIVIVTPPCENTYDYTQEICGHPLCYHNSRLIGTWDTIAHEIIPTLIIVFFSVALLLRILIQKRRIRQAFQWRKHRKMAIQLLSISTLYFFLYIPGMCIELAYFCCLSKTFNASIEQYLRFLSYYVIFLLPFVYLVSLMGSSWQLKKNFPFLYHATASIQ